MALEQLADELERPAAHARVRARTESIRRTNKTRLRELAVLYPTPDGTVRPRTRGDCAPGGVNGERPCPFVGCRHHLYIDVHPDRGAIKINFPNLEVWEMADSCSLDVASRGGLILDDVAVRMNLTRERARQLEASALLGVPDDSLIALQEARS